MRLRPAAALISWPERGSLSESGVSFASSKHIWSRESTLHAVVKRSALNPYGNPKTHAP